MKRAIPQGLSIKLAVSSGHRQTGALAKLYLNQAGTMEQCRTHKVASHAQATSKQTTDRDHVLPLRRKHCVTG